MVTKHPWAGGPHPWREWRGMPEVALHWVELPGTKRATTDGRRNVWFGKNKMLQVERRCTSRHEQEHIIAGHTGCVTGTEEARVRFRAAQWLCPNPKHVADALIASGGGVHDAADALWLDEPTFRARLDQRFMHPAERQLIHAALLEVLHP